MSAGPRLWTAHGAHANMASMGVWPRRPWVLLAVAVFAVGACSSSDEAGVAKPAKTCKVSDCPAGTTACVNNQCFTPECPDGDGDGAGVGPGCAKYDCDDSDPTIPADSDQCNGKDDDCDGLIDEGCPCLDSSGAPLPDGSTRDCGGSGTCAGTQTCTSGSWDANCVGGKTPEPEICFNGTDENCDGTLDDGCCPAGEDVCTGAAVCSSNGICK